MDDREPRRALVLCAQCPSRSGARACQSRRSRARRRAAPARSGADAQLGTAQGSAPNLPGATASPAAGDGAAPTNRPRAHSRAPASRTARRHSGTHPPAAALGSHGGVRPRGGERSGSGDPVGGAGQGAVGDHTQRGAGGAAVRASLCAGVGRGLVRSPGTTRTRGGVRRTQDTAELTSRAPRLLAFQILSSYTLEQSVRYPLPEELHFMKLLFPTLKFVEN